MPDASQPQVAFMLLWPQHDLLVLSVNPELASIEGLCRMLAALHEIYPQRTIGVSYLATPENGEAP